MQTELVCTAKVVQEVGQFGLRVLENRMFHDVVRVGIGSGVRQPSAQRRGHLACALPSALHRAPGTTRVPIPTQARASATGATALAHKSGSGRECAVEAISDFIHQLPGCGQGTSLEPVAWHYCPAAKRGPFGP